MVRIEITKHAYDRMKERLGLNKKAATRMAEIAYSDGIKHGDTSGQLYRYISAQAYAYMKKGYCLKIYGEAVYCFINRKDEETDEKTSSLVTVWVIPQNLKNQVLGLQRKKKEETVNE